MSEPGRLRIVAVGDVSLNGRFVPLLQAGGGERILAQVTPAWQAADLRLGNLEAPLTTAPRAVPCKLALRAPTVAVDFLRQAGFDCLSLANNHMMDYGPQGLAETLAHLQDAGLSSGGAGITAVAARAPLLLERQGQRVGVLAYCAVTQKSPLFAGPTTPGVAAWQLADCLREVRALRSQVEWLIVQLHWGHELAQLPSPEQRQWARQLVAAGADLILGHHPHVLQPLERIDGVPVFYSLGNFLFSDMFWRGRTTEGERFVSRYRLHPLSRRTGWAEVVLQRGRPAEVRFHPCWLRRKLTLVPAPRRLRDWQQLEQRLQGENYAADYAAEVRRAETRLRWQAAWRSPWRRLELFLFRHGLLPSAVEGT